jgi:hypothetical protein
MNDIPFTDDVVQTITRFVLHQDLYTATLLLVHGLGDTTTPGLLFSHRLDDWIMSQERNVLDQVVGLVMALSLVCWLTWIDAFQNAQLAVVCLFVCCCLLLLRVVCCVDQNKCNTPSDVVSQHTGIAPRTTEAYARLGCV